MMLASLVTLDPPAPVSEGPSPQQPPGPTGGARGNCRPIIGILAQENNDLDATARGTSYIAGSFVKFLESAGARVAPVRINRTEEEYTRLFHSINGLMLPGGCVDLQTSEFARIAKIFYELAMKANDAGDYFPIWGVCLGHQQLIVLTAGHNIRVRTDTEAMALPLTFTAEAKSSRLFKGFPAHLMQSLAEENITSNFHKWSLSLQDYNHNADLKTFYKVLSTNSDGKTDFISTMEAYRYPFYGVQWHPEKAPFEWIDKPGMDHSVTAITISFYSASFFVSEAMKSDHQFPSPLEEDEALIYNFCHVFRGHRNIFMEKYYFD